MNMSLCMCMLIGNDGEAKFSWDGNQFVLERARNLKTNDLKKIKRAIASNSDIIVKRCNELFG